MAAQTFGQALGELILQKRKTLGLTQIQLSEDAYNSSAKTRRISELESGLVANPHPKTIDPIIVALGITEAEIAECARRSARRADEDLDRAYREARNLIDAIARQFEHSQPNATLAELDDFLRTKAAEWADLRNRISSIDAPETAIATLKENAASALAEGRFSEVDALLARAENSYQNERTLIEVRKQAEIRITRGDNSLLGGDAKTALLHYKNAAGFFRPFDEEEMAKNLDEIAFKNYEIAKRSLNPAFFISSSLLEELIQLEHIKNNTRRISEAYYRLSMVFRNDFSTPKLKKEKNTIDRAIFYARKSAMYEGEPHESFRIVSMIINLANCLMDRAKIGSNSQIKDISEAISLLDSVREKFKDDVKSKQLLGHACNSLGAALLALKRIDPSADSKALTERALGAFEECISVSAIYSDAESWGAAKANIGGILATMADAPELEEQRAQFLRVRAITEYLAAIEVFPFAAFPFRTADMHEGLGNVLVAHANAVDDTLAELYLVRAIQSFETASAVFTRENSPARWARVRACIGSIFEHHAGLPNAMSPQDDIERAVKEYGEAAAVYEELTQQSELAMCREKLKYLKGNTNVARGKQG